jgi:endonuclease/exonuclease/phosphatase family metal-dependent hydrolase
VRLVTWNLWWRFGQWQERRKAIRGLLAEARPDVCGLQEIWQDPSENLAEWLADELGLYWAWGPARNQEYWRGRLRDPTVSHGVAVLSRWPIHEPRTEILSEAHSRTARFRSVPRTCPLGEALLSGSSRPSGYAGSRFGTVPVSCRPLSPVTSTRFRARP